MSSDATATRASRKPTNADRRATIVAALKQCMLTKGYADTSLTDMAHGAQMSVSHMLYYYPSKEAVLLDLASEVCERIRTEVLSMQDEPAEERLHALAELALLQGAWARSDLGISREIIALAAYKPELRTILNDFSHTILAYLEDLFSKTPRQPGLTAADTAEIASAIWEGFATNVDFDARLTSARARRLFRRSLFLLANLEQAPPEPSGRSEQIDSAGRPRARRKRAAG